MNSFAFVAVFAVLACASAAPSTILQGPSSRSTIVGPDGSAISSVAPGGAILAEENPALIARTVPLGLSTYTAPLYERTIAAPYYAHTYAAPLTYAAPTLAYSAPAFSYSSGLVANTVADTVIAGPSGTIATTKTVASPYLTTNLGYNGRYL